MCRKDARSRGNWRTNANEPELKGDAPGADWTKRKQSARAALAFSHTRSSTVALSFHFLWLSHCRPHPNMPPQPQQILSVLRGNKVLTHCTKARLPGCVGARELHRLPRGARRTSNTPDRHRPQAGFKISFWSVNVHLTSTWTWAAGGGGTTGQDGEQLTQENSVRPEREHDVWKLLNLRTDHLLQPIGWKVRLDLSGTVVGITAL